VNSAALNRYRGHPWVVLFVLCMGFFMILLDTTIVNIAIPSILTSLHTSLDQVLWVINGYILSYAVLLITAGRLGDMRGQRNMFAIGLVVFTVASALCGFSQDINQLILWRVLQGVGGAILTPQTLAILTTIFPAERRGTAFGIWGATAGLATVAGPTLGGLIVTNTDWRWIFYLNVPLGILALIATFVFIPDIRPGRLHRLDLVGVGLASGGLLAIVFGLIDGQRYNWGAVIGPVSIPVVIAAGVLLLVLFVLWERGQAEPLVPLSLFAHRDFTVASWVAAVLGFGMFGFFITLTIYLQSVLGFSALKAGLAIAPMSLISMFVAPVSGRFSDRIGGKYILMLGMGLFAAGLAFVALMARPDSAWTDFLPFVVIAGLGMGMIFAPMTTVAMRTIPPMLAGAASGVLNTTRQVGMAMGSAVIGAVLQARLSTTLHDEAVARSGQLPALFRSRFVQAFSDAARGGLELGRGQSGAAGSLPPGVPAQVAHQIQALGHEVFVNAYVDAMRPTLLVAVVVVIIGAASCAMIQRRGSRVKVPAMPDAMPLAEAGS
jgi:EmrB/QacA subfamily drug resistance transporter